MRLVHAHVACGACGEVMNATIPVSALGARIGCHICGRRRVFLAVGHAALPIPAQSSITQRWDFNAAVETIQASGFASGGQWGRA